MVHGQNCQESFRVSTDKFYGGPDDIEEDGLPNHTGK